LDAQRWKEAVEIRRAEDGLYTGGSASGCDVDRANARVRVRTAHERERQRARQLDIVDVSGATEEHPRILDTAHARAE
jgi:hypothetical protein